MSIFGFLPVISEALKLVNNLNDPVKRKEAYTLLLAKRAEKALNAGQHFILSYDSFKAGKISEKMWKYLYKKYKNRFFDND